MKTRSCNLLVYLLLPGVSGWLPRSASPLLTRRSFAAPTSLASTAEEEQPAPKKRTVAVIGAGWGGLGAAHALSQDNDTQVILIEASQRVGGLVRDGFTSVNGSRPAEAGQHGFWDNYVNIYHLLEHEIDGLGDDPTTNTTGNALDTILTDYAEQGQYSPRGLEAVWPVYRDQDPVLPTGLAQAAYTNFLNLPWWDRATAAPLVAAFSEFDYTSEAAWEKYDSISFQDLCLKLGVSQRCYEEAFEPMILTGLFAPGRQCSAAAALGMAYFFVLQSQTAFDVRWCKGNMGDLIFTPWLEQLQTKGGVQVECGTRVTGFEIDNQAVQAIRCQQSDGKAVDFAVDDVVFAVGASALQNFVKYCPELTAFSDFRNFANLRGTSVLATRIFLNKNITIPYSANACWGFDDGVGMTLFNIRALHGDDARTVQGAPGAVLEVDYYHANSLLVLSDDDIIAKVKADLDQLLGIVCEQATVVDAAVVRLPNAVNWYFPGSWKDQPRIRSSTLSNVLFAGDIVHTEHGSWSQEKAYVTGLQAANVLLGRSKNYGVRPVPADEFHVELGKNFVTAVQSVASFAGFKPPSLADFLR